MRTRNKLRSARYEIYIYFYLPRLLSSYTSTLDFPPCITSPPRPLANLDLFLQTKAIFEVHISQPSLVLDGPAVEEAVWTIDVKHGCRVYRGPAQPAPDVTLRMSDEVFCKLAEGELDGRKAFFAGQLKMKGKFMLAPKFGSVFLVSLLAISYIQTNES
jgi:hypothetical protein